MRVIVTNYTRFVRVICFLMIPMLLPAADLTIDHVTVAGKDLKAMRASLAAVGIASEYGGPHSNHATEMALTSFPDGSYLELIAIQSNADRAAVAAHYWSKHMQNNAGPTAWAVRPTDFGSEIKRCKPGPCRFSRRVAGEHVPTASGSTGKPRPWAPGQTACSFHF
jgi:hypothetical protein